MLLVAVLPEWRRQEDSQNRDFDVTVVEKEQSAGGHLNDWFKLFPDRRDSSEVLDYLNSQAKNTGIKIITGTTIEKVQRSKKSFSLTTNDGKELSAEALVVATGFDTFQERAQGRVWLWNL